MILFCKIISNTYDVNLYFTTLFPAINNEPVVGIYIMEDMIFEGF